MKITEIREGLRAQEQVAALTEALHQSRAQSLQYQNSLQNHAATLLAERRRAEALDQALEAWRARAHNEHAASTQRLVAQKEEMDLRRTMEISELQHKLDDQKQALAEAVKTEQMLKGNILEMKRKVITDIFTLLEFFQTLTSISRLPSAAGMRKMPEDYKQRMRSFAKK